MNNVALSGNICQDLELRKTQSSKSVVNFSIAINEGRDKTEFVNCVAWEKTAELISQYCKKGDRLACTGRLSTTSYDKDGEKRYKTEVVVYGFDFPPKSAGMDQHNQDKSNGYQPQPSIEEDEIPF